MEQQPPANPLLPKQERDRKYRVRTCKYMQQIGPMTSKMFAKMQILLEPCTEADRYAVLYNLLVLWKEQDEDNLLQPLP